MDRSIYILLLLFFTGCVGTAIPEEQQAKDVLENVRQAYRVDTHILTKSLPANPTQTDYLRFAWQHHPAIEAAYQEWRAVVESIPTARSLPDPLLTLEVDISDTLMSFMPGVMFDFMTQGKRVAMARAVSMEAGVAYQNFASAVRSVSVDLRKAWIDLAWIDATLTLQAERLQLIDQMLKLEEVSYATGSGMRSIGPLVELMNDLAEVYSEIGMITDRRDEARARFKYALGLGYTSKDPDWPNLPLSNTILPNDDTLWQQTLAVNPELGKMRAMIEMAMAGVDVAQKAKTPDFALGGMVDLKAIPLMFRPTASLSLPIWKDKIASLEASAEARNAAAHHRLSALELELAAEIAHMLFMVKEADRMIAYIDEAALPNLERFLAFTEGMLQSDSREPQMIPEIHLMIVAMRIERLIALHNREQAVTDLLYQMAGSTATGMPEKVMITVILPQ
jgi:outer membrane protein TolC